MKAAIILSGSIRYPEHSLITIDRLKAQGFECDVYCHTWSHVEELNLDSWSKYPVHEPTEETLNQYPMKKVIIESWPEYRRVFQLQADRWIDQGMIQNITHLGMPAMWFSMGRAISLVENFQQYDLVFRLRFDLLLKNDIPTDYVNRWCIPDAVDFGGLCDIVAWYWVDKSKSCIETLVELMPYYGVYNNLDKLFKFGVDYAPERLLLRNMGFSNVKYDRPKVLFNIHGDYK